MKKKTLLLYNLFPRLTGYFHLWKKHIDRAKQMKFNAIYINPVQYPGFSGSCYSIKDYYRIDELRYVDPDYPGTPEEQFREMVSYAHKKGMLVIMDLVINHTAIDSPLVHQHRDWYKLRADGQVENPKAMDGDRVVAVWGDLAEIDNRNSPSREELWQYWLDLVDYYLTFGIDGFRCDAAYQVPVELWKKLIAFARDRKKDVLFLAETLGCPFHEVMEIAHAGFDYVFNSSKYWDFEAVWCLEQYNQLVGNTRSISFPESHDTIRLFEEMNYQEAALKQRYLFAAFLSAAVMMPIGYEFGFRRKLDVVHTTPFDWEEPAVDLTSFIEKTNQMKSSYSIFCEESPVHKMDSPNPAVLILKKTWEPTGEMALLILNKDIYHSQHLSIPSLKAFLEAGEKIRDISPEWAMKEVPDRLEYDLKPGQGIVLYRKF